jgi:hypothetical protein
MDLAGNQGSVLVRARAGIFRQVIRLQDGERVHKRNSKYYNLPLQTASANYTKSC